MIFFSIFALADQPHFVKSCGLNELSCKYPSDGCISWEKVCDGEVDCIRDGYDEDKSFLDSVAVSIFSEGKIEKNAFCGQSLKQIQTHQLLLLNV